ncbi:MAG TPA: hypothetical protein VGM29_12180 [Polyangiaceae bacterium]|jgi:hypothetical protein
MSAHQAPPTKSPLEPLWLSQALSAAAHPIERHDEVRRLALAARQCLDSLRELHAADGPPSALALLRREATELALRAFIASHSEQRPAVTATTADLLQAAHEAGLRSPAADALSSAADETLAPEQAIGVERAIARVLRQLAWRTREELLWLRVVRCVAVPSLLFAALFAVVSLARRSPAGAEVGQPTPAAVPHAAPPARPARPPGQP